MAGQPPWSTVAWALGAASVSGPDRRPASQACTYTFLSKFDPDQFEAVYNMWPRLASCIVTLMLVLVMLVLMNLLLARMGDTYNRISEQAELEWLLQRARVVRSIETEMTDEELHVVWNGHLELDMSGRECFRVAEVDNEYWRNASARPRRFSRSFSMMDQDRRNSRWDGSFHMHNG